MTSFLPNVKWPICDLFFDRHPKRSYLEIVFFFVKALTFHFSYSNMNFFYLLNCLSKWNLNFLYEIRIYIIINFIYTSDDNELFFNLFSHFPLFFIYFLFISFIYNRDHWSSLKFNPKRHQLSLTFPCVFRFLSLET